MFSNDISPAAERAAHFRGVCSSTKYAVVSFVVCLASILYGVEMVLPVALEVMRMV